MMNYCETPSLSNADLQQIEDKANLETLLEKLYGSIVSFSINEGYIDGKGWLKWFEISETPFLHSESLKALKRKKVRIITLLVVTKSEVQKPDYTTDELLKCLK